jgi:hypothetical protein
MSDSWLLKRPDFEYLKVWSPFLQLLTAGDTTSRSSPIYSRGTPQVSARTERIPPHTTSNLHPSNARILPYYTATMRLITALLVAPFAAAAPVYQATVESTAVEDQWIVVLNRDAPAKAFERTFDAEMLGDASVQRLHTFDIGDEGTFKGYTLRASKEVVDKLAASSDVSLKCHP